MDEGVDGIILENLTDRVDTLETNVEHYLDSIYEVDNTLHRTDGEITSIRYKDLPNLKTGLLLLFLLNVAMFVMLAIVLCRILT